MSAGARDRAEEASRRRRAQESLRVSVRKRVCPGMWEGRGGGALEGGGAQGPELETTAERDDGGLRGAMLTRGQSGWGSPLPSDWTTRQTDRPAERQLHVDRHAARYNTDGRAESTNG